MFTNAPSGRTHYLDLRCSDGVAAQFLDLDHCGVHYRRVPVVDNEWTHRLEANGPPDPRVSSLANLLQDVITLPAPSPMTVALALDWYKTSIAGAEPEEWPYTPTAQMVRRGKYWKEKPRTVEAAGLWLARRLGEVLASHPTLATADVVVVVPGHDRALLSFGERLASTVGTQCGLAEVRVKSRREFRPEAKSRGSDSMHNSLPEIVELASLIGNGLFRYIPADVIDFFPIEYRRYLSGWQAGRHRLPVFAPPTDVDDVRWRTVARALHQWAADEIEFHRGPLVEANILAHQLARCLADADVASDLVLPQRGLSLPESWAALQLVTSSPCLVAVAWLPDTGEDPVERLAATIGTLHQLVTNPRPVMVILAAGTHLLAQLRLHLPDLATTNPGDKVTLPLQIAGRIGALRPATTTAPDLDLTVVFRSAPTPPVLFLLRLGKT